MDYSQVARSKSVMEIICNIMHFWKMGIDLFSFNLNLKSIEKPKLHFIFTTFSSIRTLWIKKASACNLFLILKRLPLLKISYWSELWKPLFVEYEVCFEKSMDLTIGRPKCGESVYLYCLLYVNLEAGCSLTCTCYWNDHLGSWSSISITSFWVFFRIYSWKFIP